MMSGFIKKGMLLMLFLFPVFVYSGIPDYHTYNNYSLASPGALGPGLYGFNNPAILNFTSRPDVKFSWSDRKGYSGRLNDWGLFTSLPHLGFGVVKSRFLSREVKDYRISLGVGSRQLGIGFGYGWSRGDTAFFSRSQLINVGTIMRFNRYLSLGVAGHFNYKNNERQGIVDLALRPFGDEKLTFFGDYASQNKSLTGGDKWSAGPVLELLPGVRLTSRYTSSKVISAGLQFSFGHLGVESQAFLNGSQYMSYGVRLGSYDRNIFRTYFQKRKKYIKLNLLGKIKHQRYMLFDRSKTLSSILEIINAAKQDDTVQGLAINISGMIINRELLWEIREKLVDFKTTGKHVVLYFDQVDITYYHFASVADRIVIDPQGIISLQGVLSGRFYLKDTLDKIGVGFEEWRFFKYKSAVEVFSRKDMSDADREQTRVYLQQYYDLMKSDICQARNMSDEKFEGLVNNKAVFLPKDALDNGLVDQLGRFDSIQDAITNIEQKKKKLSPPGSLARYVLPKDNEWGSKPKIAVIYALGVCAMDTGITARKLVKDIEKVKNDSEIKAVVFRVDSPGGSALASDIVAEAIKKCREKKPVIVSQGFVAGSGGYWISMYGDVIVASPLTITGSIGVIGGWIYNTGLKEKLGVTTDHIKIGDHADLGFGMPLPFLGYLPDRNLNEKEMAVMKETILTMYDGFVEKVADGRNKDKEEIETIARGRIWSGTDAKENGLIDEIGGLEKAISIAKQKSGIPEDRDVLLVEMPFRGFFNLNLYAAKMFGLKSPDEKDEYIEFIKFRIDQNGKPLPLMPIGNMDIK